MGIALALRVRFGSKLGNGILLGRHLSGDPTSQRERNMPAYHHLLLLTDGRCLMSASTVIVTVNALLLNRWTYRTRRLPDRVTPAASRALLGVEIAGVARGRAVGRNGG
jgi:hypothetical protein